MTDLRTTIEQLNAGRILDVATGSGSFLKYHTDTVALYDEAVGIDFKEAAAVSFNETFHQNNKVLFQTMDAEKMDFKDAFFDTVCISNSLHHLKNPKQVLREMLRVLKPGGSFIINEMYRDGEQTPAQQTHILLHHWWAAIDRNQNVIHNETYTRQELIDFALDLELEKLEMEDQIDLSGDPLDPEICAELMPVIQRYIDRAAGHANLQEQGEELRGRLQAIGFHNASALLLIAKKA